MRPHGSLICCIGLMAMGLSLVPAGIASAGGRTFHGTFTDVVLHCGDSSKTMDASGPLNVVLKSDDLADATVSIFNEGSHHVSMVWKNLAVETKGSSIVLSNDDPNLTITLRPGDPSPGFSYVGDRRPGFTCTGQADTGWGNWDWFDYHGALDRG